MNFGWLKRYMPRSLFGRALLIVLLPMIGLQLVVGQVFIQRHFRSVTEQMAASVILELKFAIEQVARADDPQAALDEISVNLEMLLLLNPDAPPLLEDQVVFYDLSGKTLIKALHRDIEHPLSVDLRSVAGRVALNIELEKGQLEVVISRGRVTALNPHQLLVLMLFASIILTVISILFLRNQTRPINRLAEAAEAYGKGRDVPIHPAGSTEVRRAALAFLSMRNKLERQVEQRTQMLSGVSHDLRTPLTRMKLAVELMDDTEELKADITEMEQMLDGFLAFARDNQTEAGQPVDPIALAEAVAHKCGDIPVIVTRSTADNTNVVLRQDAISRALQNLISNAQHYGNTVRLSVALSQRFLEYRVEDDGPGIPPEAVERAQQPFARLDKARGHHAGVGLGLSITLDIARAHGGTLELGKSTDLGGLSAKIVIPR
ncbi:MAG TPA: HAMP domain-containing protein [Rhodobacteraceae bacterium]|nr:HAMP domain-containing protein [Paracoccaceae bacterium]